MAIPSLGAYNPIGQQNFNQPAQPEQIQINQAELQTFQKLNEYLEKFKENEHVKFVREDFTKYLQNENKSTDEKLQTLENTISSQKADIDEMKSMIAQLLQNTKNNNNGGNHK